MDVKFSEIKFNIVCRTTSYSFVISEILIYVPFPVAFTDLQMLKIGCVNYAHFPISGHNC